MDAKFIYEGGGIYFGRWINSYKDEILVVFWIAFTIFSINYFYI